MRKKCSKFHWCTSRGLNFIDTVYELFDNPYMNYNNYMNMGRNYVACH